MKCFQVSDRQTKKGEALRLTFLVIKLPNKRITMILSDNQLFRIIWFDQKLETVSMNIHDFDILIAFQVFAEFCYKNIHASSSKIIVFAPDLSQGNRARENLIHIQAEQT